MVRVIGLHHRTGIIVFNSSTNIVIVFRGAVLNMHLALGSIPSTGGWGWGYVIIQSFIKIQKNLYGVLTL